ncbi:MAG TPA: hypothetical protein ENK32_07615 [Anaerolineae bacterium]|nr:hypothetical protein [Anaerolineae bacterium]
MLLIAAAALGYFLRVELAFTGGVLGSPLDDTWIHFQFARNLSQGNGFSFNPGDPQPGSTAPLWTLLLAGVGLFTQEFMVPALLLSAGFFLLTIGLTYGFTFRLAQNKFAAFLAGLGVALSGRLLWAGLAGMETTAFAAFSLAAVWLYTKQGLRPVPALLFALASQIRPEGHLLFGLAALDVLVQWLMVNHQWSMVNFKRLIAQFGPPLLIYALVAAPYALFSLDVTGKPLPNTFYAKADTAQFFSWRTLRETMALHWQDNPVSLILVLFGLLPAWRKSRLAVLWLVGLWLLTPVIVDQVWHHGRYTMPLIPFQMVVAGVGLAWLLQRLGNSGWRQKLPNYPITQLLILLIFTLAALWQLPKWADMLATNTKEVQDIDVALGLWLAENTPPDALIAVDDIGAIGFLSGRRIVDMNGLVSPEMWPAVRQPVGLPRDRALTRLLSQSQPDYMAAFPLWHWELTSNTAVSRPIHKVETATHTIIFQPEAFVYQTDWPYLADAQPQEHVDAVFGEAIELVGYDAGGDEANLELTLYWRSLAPVDADYDVFIHVVDGDGNILAQVDRQPLNSLAATSVWQPGDIVRDRYTIPLPPDLPQDTAVRVGLYLRETGVRLPVNGSDFVEMVGTTN